MDISELRSDAAQNAFQAYDFGDTVVEDAGGWEHSTPGTEWTRTIYLQPEIPSEPTQKGHFTVVFEKDSAELKEAYGVFNGNILGPTPPTPSA